MTTTPLAIPTPWIVTSTSSPTKSSTSSPTESTTSPPTKSQPLQEPEVVPSSKLEYPDAPDRPPKPFHHYLKSEISRHVNKPDFNQHITFEKCRADWKKMKTKEKGEWIQLALDEYNKYEDHMSVYMRDNPGYVPPERKNFLTAEEKKILDKSKGRPEMPPSSAYSLFSKNMLNEPEMRKMAPAKERMGMIGIKFKMLDQAQKALYQKQVSESMAKYTAEYEIWFDNLDEKQKAAERERGNKCKNKNKKFVPALPGFTA